MTDMENTLSMVVIAVAVFVSAGAFTCSISSSPSPQPAPPLPAFTVSAACRACGRPDATTRSCHADHDHGGPGSCVDWCRSMGGGCSIGSSARSHVHRVCAAGGCGYEWAERLLADSAIDVEADAPR